MVTSTTSNKVDIGFILGVLDIEDLRMFRWQVDLVNRLLMKYTVSNKAVLPGAVVYGVNKPQVNIR